MNTPTALPPAGAPPGIVPWNWVEVCALDDLVPNLGACALAGGRPIALFRVVADGSDPGSVYAIDNYDAKAGASVLSRGIVGDLQGEVVVASPLYKQHYSLRTGRCLEYPEHSVRAFPVRVLDGQVQVGVSVTALRRAAKAQRQRLVVVGHGTAGRQVVDELRQVAPDLYDITVVGAADPAVGVNRVRRVVRTQRGHEIAYDRLLLATGARPALPPIPGTDSAGVVALGEMHDLDAVLEAARGAAQAVVIGGGLLALEAANGLLREGLRVCVVHPRDRLMERALDKPAAALLEASLRHRGLAFRDTEARAILGSPRAHGVRLADGSEIGADLVVIAAGLRPEIALAQKIGLRCERGVLVSDTLQTFDPRIYAVGACVQHRNATYGLATPLAQQVRTCASQLAELGHSRYPGTSAGTARLKVSGIDLYSAGDFIGEPGSEDLVYRDTRRGVYKRLVLKGNRVTGAVLYGDVRDANWYFELIRNATDVGAQRDRLLFGPDLAGELADGA